MQRANEDDPGRLRQAENGPHLLFDARHIERTQRDLARQASPVELRQKALQCRAALFAAVRDEQPVRSGHGTPRQVKQDLEARFVTPVNILDEDEMRSSAAKDIDECGNLLHDPPPLSLWVECGRDDARSGRYFGKECLDPRRNDVEERRQIVSHR